MRLDKLIVEVKEALQEANNIADKYNSARIFTRSPFFTFFPNPDKLFYYYFMFREDFRFITSDSRYCFVKDRAVPSKSHTETQQLVCNPQ